MIRGIPWWSSGKDSWVFTVDGPGLTPVGELVSKKPCQEKKMTQMRTYLWNINWLADVENRLVVARGESIVDYKVLCMVWINNKVLLYSMESCIQHPVIHQNGKEYILKNNIGGGKGINIHQQKKGDHLQICVWFLFALSNLKPLLLLLPSLVKKKSVGFQTLSRTPPIISLLTFCLTLGQLLNLTKLHFPYIQTKVILSVMVRVVLSVITVNFQIFRGLTQ